MKKKRKTRKIIKRESGVNREKERDISEDGKSERDSRKERKI